MQTRIVINQQTLAMQAAASIKASCILLQMHPDLSSHLHTDECNKCISMWRQCRKDHALGKFVGICNSYYSEMLACMKKERLARRAENFRKSNEWKKRIAENVKKLDQAKGNER